MAKTKQQRTRLADLGVSIESVKSDCVYGTATDGILGRVRRAGFRVGETFVLGEGISPLDFPSDDARFHNYAEASAVLDQIVALHPDRIRKFSIGKTTENRDIWAVQINSSGEFHEDGAPSGKPGIVFMGNHHAREHLSAEIPLMLLEYLATNMDTDAEISRLVNTRDIFVIPMVNPDGVEYDISTGRYKSHRKNMRQNGRSGFRNCVGVDLNRNYGYGWGTGGSSTDTCSDVYMGTTAFSEPETQAIKAFVEGRPNLKVLLSFHTFSELILYPWGGKYEPIEDENARRAYQTMARTMAGWNGYTPEQSSELYIASGDTTDWAWGQLGIFSFTFELSPRDMWNGGFYPGAGVIDNVFAANLRPALFLIDLADDPYRVLQNESDPLRDPRFSWLR
jgi:carboxypeptidase T